MAADRDPDADGPVFVTSVPLRPGAVEASAKFRHAAHKMFELYTALMQAGFDHDTAVDLVARMAFGGGEARPDPGGDR